MLANNYEEFQHNYARWFNIKVLNISSGKAMYYNILALEEYIKYIQKNNIENAIVYILTCRIGHFVGSYKTVLEVVLKLIVK